MPQSEPLIPLKALKYTYECLEDTLPTQDLSLSSLSKFYIAPIRHFHHQIFILRQCRFTACSEPALSGLGLNPFTSMWLSSSDRILACVVLLQIIHLQAYQEGPLQSSSGRLTVSKPAQ